MRIMPHAAAARMTTRERDAAFYQRHRPEQTLLYRIVDEYYPAFVAHLGEQGRELPGYVQREFEDYLKCGRLEYGFWPGEMVLRLNASSGACCDPVALSQGRS
jgi:hypothetical protein